MSIAAHRHRVSRRPDARPGQHAVFYFEDGRCLEIRVPGAVALSCASARDLAPVCTLRDEHGELLGEVDDFAALLSAGTAPRDTTREHDDRPTAGQGEVAR